MKFNVNNPPKFWLLVLGMVSMVLLVVTKSASWDDVKAYFGMLIGYGVGNGVAAAKGQPSTPVFGPKETA